MKTQMRFQKILMLVSLILSAVCLVFAFVFCSGVFAQLVLVHEYAPETEELFEVSQNFSTLFQTLGIIFVLVAVLLFIAACNKRRKYYVTNYVAIGIFVVYALVYAILLIVNLVSVSGVLAATDLTVAKETYDAIGGAESYFGEFQTTSWTIYLGYALFALVVVDVVFIVLNLVWKIKLMQGEKALLQNSLQKEAQ